MAGRLTERMAEVLLTAAGRPSARAFNDGRPNYMRTRAGLITRGYLAERGSDDYLTPEGRAAVAERIDRIKAAARGRGEAAELAELAHMSELARRLDWRPTGGDRVQVIGGQVGMVLYNGHQAAGKCRRCGRVCRYVDLSIGGGHHYGYAQCEVAPLADTLAAHLTERADKLAEAIDLDPAYPAADRWRVDLARLRRLATEVTEAGPVSEEAGPEVAELAADYDRAVADYMTAPAGPGLADVTVRHLGDALRSARAGRHPGTHLLALAAARQAAKRAEPRCSIREGGNFRGPVVAECAGAAGGCPHCTKQAEVESAFTPSPAAVASLAERQAAEAEAERQVADPAPRWHADSHRPVAAMPDYDDQAEAAEAADEWAAFLAELAERAVAEAEAGGKPTALDELAQLAHTDPAALAALTELAEQGRVACWWTLLCDRPADHLATHPVLRYVTACQRCRPTEAEAAR